MLRIAPVRGPLGEGHLESKGKLKLRESNRILLGGGAVEQKGVAGQEVGGMAGAEPGAPAALML